MKRIYRTPGTSGGFSLIEVMIAVVVLATGLLALAALQGSLTRSSAEAKVRSRVAAMLSARMDELRGGGYDNVVLDPGSATLTSNASAACDGDATDWLDCARGQANLSSLAVTQTNTLFTSAVNAAAFGAVDDRADVGEGDPEFIRVALDATWTDSSGVPHTLGLTSELSSLALRDSILPPPAASSTLTGAPIVRQDNPAGPGVIPIAVGGGDATAASNPRPEQVGKTNNTTVTGTRFDVLTYTGLTGAAVIQRRVETAVIKCQCTLGAGGTNLPVIYQKSMWPAVWTGERYEVYKPDPAADAPGEGKASGPTPGVDQSPLCQECCRDHFDTTRAVASSNDPPRFDPARNSHQHYLVANGSLTALSTLDSGYVEACRIIRVDGFWRTAADAYSRHFGLLATETVSGKEAATGLPDDSDPVKTATNYQTFVKDYLAGAQSGTVPGNAQTLFDDPVRQLNEPVDVDIETPSSTDYRYLHGRGLYLDFLEKKARNKIAAVLADTGPNGKCPTGADRTECILPYLPFTTINVTELAKWAATDTNILSVNSGGQLGTNPTQPSGGRTVGVKKGVTDNTATINMSNFGLAASNNPFFNSLTGVDPEDVAASGADNQVFDVGGNNAPPSSGEQFTVSITGVTTQDPDVFYAVGDSGECLRPDVTSPWRCATNTPTISGGTVTISNYWVESTVTKQKTFTCGNKTGSFTVSVPIFYNYQVLSASIGGVQGALSAVAADGKVTESTTATFGTELQDGSIVDVVIAAQGTPVDSNYSDCKITGSNPEKISDIVWSYQWKQP